MSKAFTKEDASDEPIVAPRAPLPPGVPNYVTPRGLVLLRAELARLDEAIAGLADDAPDEDERRRRTTILSQRRAELVDRIAGARPVEPDRQAQDAVRFGATVTMRTLDGRDAGRERRLRIVGVDEADPVQGTIAFTSPLARALLGHAAGDDVELETADGEQQIEIVAVDYLPDPP